MAHLLQQNVLVVCSCGSLKPLTKLYFCRHCVVLRCGYCVSQEVDSIYCSNCLENLASSEAKLKKNRCGACFDCPCCFHTLTIRATTVSRINTQPEGSPASASKTSVKSYYLSCFFCRWTSRDAKIPDQPTATSSNWPEHENPHVARISSLIEYYKIITLRERLEKENRMFLHSSRRNYQHFSEKFGLTAMLARKRAGLPPLSLGRDDSSSTPQVTPAEASEEVEALPENIFSEPVNVLKLTSLPQRYVIPDLQPEFVADLFPIHKQLFIKRSQRCKSCLHNIFKPEYGPASIKFKIHLAAYYYVPEIRIMEMIKAKSGKATELCLKISNPAQISTQIQFLQLIDVPEESPQIEVPIVDEKKDDTGDKKSLTGVTTAQKKAYPLEKPRIVKYELNSEIILPNVTFHLPARDDTAEYDDSSESQPTPDHISVVWKKGNKLVVKFSVIPNEDLVDQDEIRIGFIMRYTYHDKIISPLEQKEGKDVNIDVRHYLNVGSIE
ncbi:hypothetical protein V9T40_009105 [Parthenolecanium corni]|uniref:Dynactin subunit 4 n=1 Tax=Parthenolecanium corni TaxID=536013 RepID=A0AAN9TZ34_9HEMI